MKKTNYLIYVTTISYEWNGEEGAEDTHMFVCDDERWLKVKEDTPYSNLEIDYEEPSYYEHDESLGNCSVEYYTIRTIEGNPDRYIQIIDDYNQLLNGK